MTTDTTANRPADETPSDIPEMTMTTTHDSITAPNTSASGASDISGAVETPQTLEAAKAAHEAEWLARFDADVPRTTVRDSWNWAWKDTAMRVLPFVAAAGVYARLSGNGLDGIGVTYDGWQREALIGIAIGVPLAGLAAFFRGKVSPGYRLPTAPDQLAQTLFYFTVNAPGEELFWRGAVQDLAVRGLALVPRIGKMAGLLGWAATTAVFGAYHRLGNWSWRSIAGVTFAGALCGALYQWPRGKRSLLAPTIAHGFATAGFLSWADVYLHLRQKRRYLALMRTAKEA
jgi:membrane protease YdiL (CAAX protease family)